MTWTEIKLDFGMRTPVVCCAREYSGTLEGTQVHALQLIHNLGTNLKQGAAALAASMTRAVTA
jgi:hypothetical protein